MTGEEARSGPLAGGGLGAAEARVLGCLVEKELATPEYYPLTLNALVAACNQRSNRDPVLELAEAEVSAALSGLREKQLAVVAADGGRSPRYRHFLVERLDLPRRPLAVLCELLLRGAQTSGELRGRAGRMADFPDLASVQEALATLESAHPPLAALLPRRPGQKEGRYAHLMSGAPREDSPPVRAEGGGLPAAPEDARLERLEAGMASLKEELLLLRAELESLKSALGEGGGGEGGASGP